MWLSREAPTLEPPVPPPVLRHLLSSLLFAFFLFNSSEGLRDALVPQERGK